MGFTMPRSGASATAYTLARPARQGRSDCRSDCRSEGRSDRAYVISGGSSALPAGAPTIVESCTEAAPVAVHDDVLDLATLCVNADHHAARLYVQRYGETRPMEAVCHDLLAPTARYLGELWDEDLCSFTDVTIGLLRLQDALHGVTADITLGGADGFRRHTIVLAAAPGDQHTFGLSMVSAFFQKAGWAVNAQPDSTLPELGALLRREWIGVLGFTVGSSARLERLAAIIPRLREVSRNRGLGVLVGGPVFLANPGLAAQIGADGTATDGTAAVALAENLLAGRTMCD